MKGLKPTVYALFPNLRGEMRCNYAIYKDSCEELGLPNLRQFFGQFFVSPNLRPKNWEVPKIRRRLGEKLRPPNLRKKSLFIYIYAYIYSEELGKSLMRAFTDGSKRLRLHPMRRETEFLTSSRS